MAFSRSMAWLMYFIENLSKMQSISRIKSLKMQVDKACVVFLYLSNAV